MMLDGCKWFTAQDAARFFWPAFTIGLYSILYALYRRSGGKWYVTPIIWVPLGILGLAHVTQTSYGLYKLGSQYLVMMLGPATVAFAVSIYERRLLIQRYWPVLTLGILSGSLVSWVSGWALAHWLCLPLPIRLSVLPRSVSTPFAMPIAGMLGGMPDLTAVLVILSGVVGAVLGEGVLSLLSVRHSVLKGVALGMAAHGMGTARAYQIGEKEGVIAGLTMILAGVANVLTAYPLLSLMKMLHLI